MNISNRTFGNKMFWINKRLFDIIVCLLLLPLLFIVSIIVLFFNYFLNPGSLFFIQDRMGKDCSVFSAIKFRSMAPVKEITRKYDDPIETTKLQIGFDQIKNNSNMNMFVNLKFENTLNKENFGTNVIISSKDSVFGLRNLSLKSFRRKNLDKLWKKLLPTALFQWCSFFLILLGEFTTLLKA